MMDFKENLFLNIKKGGKKMKISHNLVFFIIGYLIFNLLVPLSVLVKQGFQVNIIEIIRIATDSAALHTYWITVICSYVHRLHTQMVLIFPSV